MQATFPTLMTPRHPCPGTRWASPVGRLVVLQSSSFSSLEALSLIVAPEDKEQHSKLWLLGAGTVRMDVG